jgi:protein transport protein SEC24
MLCTGPLSTMTGGQIYYYPQFDLARDAYALQCDMLQSVTRETGFDGVMVVRTSAGLKPVEYFGNYFRRHPNELEFPAIDSDKAVAVRIVNEGELEDKSNVCIQAAMLYTTYDGQRCIRVHTLQVTSTMSMSSLFRSADLDSVVCISLKQGMFL